VAGIFSQSKYLKMALAKTNCGEFPITGYESFDIHFPIENKPADGFVYVKHKDGEEGAIPKRNVLNWDELPNHVELSDEKKVVRTKCPDYIRSITGF
jgi:hypothetical protein